MKKTKNKTEVITEPDPWIFDKDDLDPSDPLYKISRPYRIWHEYLRISSTFAIAIKEYERNFNKLTELDLKRDVRFPLHHDEGLQKRYFELRELTSDERLRIPDLE